MGPLLTLGLSAAGLLANVFGQSQAARQTKKAEGVLEGQIADLSAWRDTEVNRPFLESNVGRSVITKATDQFKDQAKQAESAASVLGASDESVIATKGKAKDALGDVFSNVARYGAAREDQIEGRYQNTLSNLLGQKTNMLLGKAQSGANLAGTAGDFLSGLAPMFAKDNTNLPAVSGT